MSKQQALKVHNRTLILNAVRQHGMISRAEVARKTGLSVGTVTGLTGELIQTGLIYEKQEGDSRGGRPPILLSLYPAGAYVIGLKLTEDHLTFALTNLDADVVARTTMDLTDSTPSAVADRIAEGVSVLLRRSGIPDERLIGVGVGMAGVVDAEQGICHTSPILGWKDVPFADMVKQRTGYPAYIDNDVNTLTLVEKLYGAGIGLDHFLTITIGRGIGLGIVVNGRLYRGMGGAGEFGHTVIDTTGDLCACGKRGCLETFVADPWLVKRARKQQLVVETADELAAHAGYDTRVATLLRNAGEVLGRSVAMLVNIFHPQLLIFSGEGMRYGDYLLVPMREALFANIMPPLGDSLRLHCEPLGDDAWARGAAGLVLQELFHAPELGWPQLASKVNAG